MASYMATPTQVTSIKLGDRKEVLADIAKRRNQTVHSLVLQAVDMFTEQEKEWRAFEEQAITSYHNMRKAGLHVTQDEMKAWANGLNEDTSLLIPTCHK